MLLPNVRRTLIARFWVLPVKYSRKSALQHLLEWMKKQCGEKLKVCELPTCNMRIAGLQYANG